jgi:hypothetical protein
MKSRKKNLAQKNNAKDVIEEESTETRKRITNSSKLKMKTMKMTKNISKSTALNKILELMSSSKL